MPTHESGDAHPARLVNIIGDFLKSRERRYREPEIQNFTPRENLLGNLSEKIALCNRSGGARPGRMHW